MASLSYLHPWFESTFIGLPSLCREEFAADEALSKLCFLIFFATTLTACDRGYCRYRFIRSLDESEGAAASAVGTKEDIIASLQMKLPEVIQCYGKPSLKDPTLSGRLEINLRSAGMVLSLEGSIYW